VAGLTIAGPTSSAEAAVPCPSAEIFVNTGTFPLTLLEYSPAGTLVSSHPTGLFYDIAFSSDGNTLYGVYVTGLSVIDPATGATLSSKPITGVPGLFPNALSATADGNLLMGNGSVIYTVDPATGAAVPYASFPAGYGSGGDFITVSDGDIIVSASATVADGGSPLFRLHPDRTFTRIGTIPSSFGLAQSSGVVYSAGPDGILRSIDALPAGPSTAMLPTTPIADAGGAQLYGATSKQDSGCAPFFQQQKVSDKASYVVSDPVTYTITVTNTGPYPGTAALVDPVPSTVLASTVTCVGSGGATCTGSVVGNVVSGSIDAPPGGVATFTVSGTAVAAGSATNVATVTPTTTGCGPECGGGDASTSSVIASADARLSLVKTAFLVDTNGNGLADSGEAINYTFLVTNTGNVTVSTVGVTDPKVGPVSCPAQTLAPGASTTCATVSSYFVTDADVLAGGVVNTATAQGTPPPGIAPIVPPSDTVTTPTPVPVGGLAIAKSAQLIDANGNGLADAGETIQYSFLLTNTGTVALSTVGVTDPKAGSVTCPQATLAVGASETCTADNLYTVVEADVLAGGVQNTATGHGTPPPGVSPIAPPTDTIVVPSPIAGAGLSLLKSAQLNDTNGDGLADVGETIQYSFVLTNTGNVTLNSVTVSDPKAGPVTCSATTLAPGAATTCTADNLYTVTEADLVAGGVVNTAMGGATPPPNVGVIPPTATLTTPTPAAAAGLALVKSGHLNDANGNGLADAGETIDFSFELTNTGNTTLTAVGVSDPKAGAVTCPTATLAPDASETCTADAAYTVTEADILAGNVVNTATGTATPPAGVNPIVPPVDTVTIPAAIPVGSLTLVKNAHLNDANGNGLADLGETIDYTFDLTNTGNTTLSALAVDDPKAGSVTCPQPTLAPAATITCTADNPYTVTETDIAAGDVVNVATANGTPPAGVPPIVPASDTVTTPVNPAEVIPPGGPGNPGPITLGPSVATGGYLVTNAPSGWLWGVGSAIALIVAAGGSILLRRKIRSRW